MRVVLTGSSGRVGRAIYGALVPEHQVVGVDRNAFSTTHVIGDCGDAELMKRVCEGADAIIHTAGPHAPHVGLVPDAEFERINIEATRSLYEIAQNCGARRFLYTSTTALYAHAIEPGACTWVTEETEPRPRTIYHRTNLAAERLLQELANEDCPVRALRMSRCFPEPADIMATYRLHRGIDARDVANGHVLALNHEGKPFERFILSGHSPFAQSDCAALAHDAELVLRERAPELAAIFDARGWALPQAIDRVYAPTKAMKELGWRPRFGWDEVIRQADRADLEVLPVGALGSSARE